MQAAPGKHGGLRRSSGRRGGHRTTVERVARPALKGREALHVTIKLRAGLPHLRRHHTYRTLRAQFRRGKDRFGFRLAHYAVLSNHIHLICEANDTRALSRGMQGLSVRIARALNRVAGRKGKVFADRYHLHVLDSPRLVRNTLAYVLQNAVRHGALPAGPALDVYSSAGYFDGWNRRLPPVFDDGPPPVVSPRGWLLRVGWRRWGLIDPDSLEAERPRT